MGRDILKNIVSTVSDLWWPRTAITKKKTYSKVYVNLVKVNILYQGLYAKYQEGYIYFT